MNHLISLMGQSLDVPTINLTDLRLCHQVIIFIVNVCLFVCLFVVF